MGDIFGGPSKEHSSTQSVGTQGSHSTGNTSSFANSNSSGASNSNSNSNSSNLAYGALSGALQPQIANGTGASNALMSLLGVGGDPNAQQSAFDQWRNSTGYQFGLDQGSQAITQNAAAKGLLNSGSTLRGLDKFGQDYANTQYQNYMNPLFTLLNSGTSAANALSGAGNVSNATSGSNSYQVANGSQGSVGNTQSDSFGNTNSMGLIDSRGQSSGWSDLAGNALSDVAKMFL